MLRVLQPTGSKAGAPALRWGHGGGLIFGAPEQDNRTNIAVARERSAAAAGQPIRCNPSPKSMRARSARETIPSLGNTLAR